MFLTFRSQNNLNSFKMTENNLNKIPTQQRLILIILYGLFYLERNKVVKYTVLESVRFWKIYGPDWKYKTLDVNHKSLVKWIRSFLKVYGPLGPNPKRYWIASMQHEACYSIFLSKNVWSLNEVFIAIEKSIILSLLIYRLTFLENELWFIIYDSWSMIRLWSRNGLDKLKRSIR